MTVTVLSGSNFHDGVSCALYEDNSTILHKLKSEEYDYDSDSDLESLSCPDVPSSIESESHLPLPSNPESGSEGPLEQKLDRYGFSEFTLTA